MGKKNISSKKRNYEQEYSRLMEGFTGNNNPTFNSGKKNGFFVKLSKFHRSASINSSNTSLTNK